MKKKRSLYLLKNKYIQIIIIERIKYYEIKQLYKYCYYWGGGYNPWAKQPFAIKALNGSTNIKFAKTGSPSAITLYSKINNSNWTSYTVGNDITLAKDQICYFSGTTQTFSKDKSNYYKLSASSNIEALGNINSLVNGSNNLNNYKFNNLFYVNTRLKDATNLILPYKKLIVSSYENMFYWCTALTGTPSLPATELADWCYYNMFFGCSKLSSVSQNLLPATTLAPSCYVGMFGSCSGLIQAPALPATTLVSGCYYSMFQNCNALLMAPPISGLYLQKSCCYNMFQYANNLSSIEVHFTSWSNLGASWLQSVASNGIFIKPEALPIIRSNDGSYIPNNWTILNRINGNLYYAEATGGHAAGDPYNP